MAAWPLACSDWVSLGPYVRCGAACEPTGASQCGRFGSRYNRSGLCVCAEEADCENYPCELPANKGCFIAGFRADGVCDCLALRKAGACGQPCETAESCGGEVAEFNASGACACGPALCPCGQVCAADVTSDCLLLRQYNENGKCACAPVKCPACKDKPCCSEPCGTECSIVGCVEDGSGNCGGFCDKSNECVKGAQVCPEPK